MVEVNLDTLKWYKVEVYATLYRIPQIVNLVNTNKLHKSNIMYMKKKVYRVRTQYIFEGVFEVVAESREDARQKVIQNCGLVMGGNIHSTLPDEEVNWAFSTHPDVRTGRITVQEEQTE